MRKPKHEMNIEKGMILHDEMARHIMSRLTFKTFQDIKKVLVYNPKTGRYQFNGEAVINMSGATCQIKVY